MQAHLGKGPLEAVEHSKVATARTPVGSDGAPKVSGSQLAGRLACRDIYYGCHPITSLDYYFLIRHINIGGAVENLHDALGNVVGHERLAVVLAHVAVH